MRIAITGSDGQLGQALCARLAPNHDLVELRQPTFELDSPNAVAQITATQAQLVIHPAAFTNVDGCARDPELAYRINGLGTRYVALACQKLNIPLVYISTNEVFSGTNAVPYFEDDQTAPVNAYGISKLAGEQAVRELLNRFYIVRIAWLFGGERNFVRTILRLLNDPPENGLRIVDDEIGSPTYTYDVANALAQLIEYPFYGTYHLVNHGSCSRYEFAREIANQANKMHVPMTPIKLAEYQRASTPPPYTPLANIAASALGISMRPWQEALKSFLGTINQ